MTSRLERQRYKVDLAAQQSVCEANYARLYQLLQHRDEDSWSLAIDYRGHVCEVEFSVCERAPYTLTLDLQWQPPLTDWQPPAKVRVRLYHDAKMAEVVAWNSQRHWQPRYEYPNRQAHQCNEKALINSFLAEWLSHCLVQGYRADAMIALGDSG